MPGKSKTPTLSVDGKVPFQQKPLLSRVHMQMWRRVDDRSEVTTRVGLSVSPDKEIQLANEISSPLPQQLAAFLVVLHLAPHPLPVPLLHY